MSTPTFRFAKAAAQLFQEVTLEEGRAVVICKLTRERAYNRFVTHAANDIRAMANNIYRRWRLPPEVDVEDLIQEINLGVWTHLAGFNPDAGSTYFEYLRFNSFAAAKKFAHKQRYAILHHNPGVNKSRLPVHLEDMGHSDGQGERTPPQALRFEADQEDAFERARTEDRVMRTLLTVEEFHAFTAFRDSGGNLEEAVDTLMFDPVIRRKLNIWCEKDAKRVILKSVRAVSARANV
jgi:DNA-directed RNA polymerase specialized sigma24 family protein